MNIGMFPLSGIRVCDTELLRLGLTLPGFVERSRTIASLPSLGLLTLAGMTPAAQQIVYQEVPDINAMQGLPGGLDLAVISSFSAQVHEAYELARRFRAVGVPTVIGGPHVSAVPVEASAHCDAVAVGEGEAVWRQVLDDAAAGRLQQIYRAGPDEFDLAQAPMPAFELLDLSHYNRLTVQTSRGCPHQCEFCASSVVLTRRYKQKPVARVLAEIDRILSIWDRPFLEFADDNSFVDHAYWKELLRALKGKGLRWFAETDLSVAADSELLDLLRQAGCVQVLIGLESPVPEGLHGLELKHDWKYRQYPHYRDAVRTVQEHGITVNGCFIIGLDGQTPDIFREVPDFAEACGLYDVQVTLLTPFPGTPLYARLQQEGRLLEADNWKTCTLFDINFVPDGMSVEQLRQGFHNLVVELYSEAATARRRRRFRRGLQRHSRHE